MKLMYDSLIEHWCFLPPHPGGILIGRFHLLDEEDSLAEKKRAHRAAHKEK